MANNKVKFGMGILSILQKMATCFIVVLPLLCGCGNETKQIENQHEIKMKEQHKTKCDVQLEEDAHHNLYSNIYRYVALVKSGDSIGSGFIGKIDGKAYLYTCLHCVIGEEISFLDSNGQKLVPSTFEICKGRDLVRFSLPKETDGLNLIKEQELRIGMEVTAYGDSQGIGVITQTKGKVLALGRDLVEIDAGVQHGNSGGPIVDNHGCVIAVVSFGHLDNDVFTKDTRFDKVRRFGVRLTNAEWIKCNLEQFNKELSYLKNANYFLKSCEAFENAINLSAQNKSCLKWSGNSDTSDPIHKGFSQSINTMYQEYNEAVEMENKCRKYITQIDNINVPISKLEAAKISKSREIEEQKSRIKEQTMAVPNYAYRDSSRGPRSNDELRLDVYKSELSYMESYQEQITSALSQAYKKREELIEGMSASNEKAYYKFVLACCDIPERTYKRILYSLEMFQCDFLAIKKDEIRKRIEERYCVSVNERRVYLSSLRQAMIKFIESVKQRYGVTVNNAKSQSREEQKQKGDKDRGKVNIRVY